MKEKIKALEEVSKPVADYLKSNFDPHCTVIITDSHIRLVRDEIGIPVRNNELEKKVAALEGSVQAQPQDKLLHSLSIIKGRVKLDSFTLKGVTSYEIKTSSRTLADITLNICVETSNVFVD